MSGTKKIPAERVKDAEGLLWRLLQLLGELALKRKLKVYPFQIAQWEQELAFCLEELNDMQETSLNEGDPEPTEEEAGKNG